MQVAAAAPVVIRREEVPAEKIEAERVIEIDRARAEGKPEAAMTKISEGRINKWFAEVALLEQPFVKDPKVVDPRPRGGRGEEDGHDDHRQVVCAHPRRRITLP